jgi:hypothetical protein
MERKQLHLGYQGDGNLVVYDKNNKPLWNSQTNGKTPNKLVFQGDGNLVLYGANNDVHWAAYCHNKGGKSLRLNNAGSLTVSTDKNYIWSTGAEVSSIINQNTDNTAESGALPSSTNRKAWMVNPYKSTVLLASPNKKYKLILERNGDLIMYNENKDVVWHSNTIGRKVYRVDFNSNLMLLASDGNPIWSTLARFGNTLQLDDNGKLSINISDKLLWKYENETSCKVFPYVEPRPSSFNVGDKWGGGIVIVVDNSKQHGVIAETQDQGNVGTWQEAAWLLWRSENHSEEGKKYDDWRLPTVDELRAMYHKAKDKLGLDKKAKYWSSEYYNPGMHWSYDGVNWAMFDNNKLKIRGVRNF